MDYLCVKSRLKLLLLSVLLSFGASITAQGGSVKISINRGSMTIKEALQEVEKQSKMSVAYNQSKLKDSNQITLNMTDQPLNVVLAQILEDTGFSYEVKDDQIMIVSAKSMAQADKKTIKGQLLDKNGEPLIGAAILIKGTSTGTATDINGNYTLLTAKGDVLSFTYLGFDSQLIAVADQATINVVMLEKSTMLDDIIVIGYGTTTRRRSVGAVDQVKASAFQDRPVSNITQALQGSSPSLTIQQRSHDPNDQQLNINIRGIGTMNDNSPLIVIDGLISDGGSFNKLNPADIENVSVLKDAGTAAIYGSRAASGVVLVTTKKGRKNQAPEVKLSAMMGWNDPITLYTPVEGYQNATLYNIHQTNAGRNPKFSAAEIRDLHENGNGKFLMDDIVQTALQQNYNVSVSGGGENSTYMVSAGMYDQENNFVGPDYGVSRYNFRTNITTEYKRFKLTALLSYVRNNSKRTIAGNAIVDAYRVPTYYYNKHVDPETGKYMTNDVLTQYNSYGLLMDGGWDKNRNDYVNPNVALEMKIIEGLKLKGVFGADIVADTRHTREFQVAFYDMGNLNGNPRYANTDRRTEDWNKKSTLLNSQIMLDYDNYFGKHHVAGLIGASNESFTSKESQVRIINTDPDTGIKGDGSVIVPGETKVVPEGTTRRSINSIFGRASYDFDDKYFGEFTFRYDGSSKFDSGLRWGFFPSVSGGWRISQESFMEDYKKNVGELKIRASYGTLGNQSVDDYQYMTTYSIHPNTYGFNNIGVGGAGFKLGTENLRWEISRTINVGADATFLDNALNVGFDFFVKNTKDILVKPQIPLMYGTEVQNYNAGKMRTKGWELTIGYALETGEFKHNFGFNIGDSWNEIVSYEGFQQIDGAEEFWTINRVGLPFKSYFGYKTDGIFQSYEEIEKAALPAGVNVQPGDLKFTDQNGDGVIDANDRTYLGNGFPRYSYGLTYNLDYKGFDFSMLWQGVMKRDFMLRGELVEPFHSSYGWTMYEHQLDFWTPTNTDAKYPRLSADVANNWKMGSDIYKFDGAYLRLKNIQIGYTLPKNIVSKVGVNNLRIYANAQNLFTFSSNSFFDPEMSNFNSSMGTPNATGASSGRAYPYLKYYGMGIDITF